MSWFLCRIAPKGFFHVLQNIHPFSNVGHGKAATLCPRPLCPVIDNNLREVNTHTRLSLLIRFRLARVWCLTLNDWILGLLDRFPGLWV